MQQLISGLWLLGLSLTSVGRVEKHGYLPNEAVEKFLTIEHRVLAHKIILKIHLRTDFCLLTQQSFLPEKVLLWSREGVLAGAEKQGWQQSGGSVLSSWKWTAH